MTQTSHEEHARMERALSQRMYLIDLHTTDTEYIFNVQGTTGNEYDIVIGPDDMSCSCPDHAQRGLRCKHMYFVMYRALGFGEWDQPTNEQIEEAASILVASRECIVDEDDDKKKNSESKTIKVVSIRPYAGETCAICLEEMDEDCKVVSCTVGCGNSVHHDCFGRWKVKQKTCVYCRASLLS